MFEKLRYSLAVLKNSSMYLNAFNDYFLDYYLRHHKIIGWFQGKPVYSVFLNPGLSKPLGNTLARRLMSNLLNQPLPGIINVALTDICNARCEHCSFYNAMDKPGERVLKTKQFIQVLKQCQDFGISVMNFVGGEPLLRNDLFEVLNSVDKDKTTCSVYTNGWFLEQKVGILKKAGIMGVIVSLDAITAKKHDAFRKLPGLFDRAIAGIKAAQKAGLITAISTTLIQDELEDGTFEKMIHFAKDLKVNELIVYDTMPIGMYSHREDLSKRKVNRKQLFHLTDTFSQRKDYPGILCYAHIRDISTFGCSAGRNYFYLSPYGEMHPCDFTTGSMGNLLEEPIAHVWKKLVQHKANHKGDYLNSCCTDQPELINIGSK